MTIAPGAACRSCFPTLTQTATQPPLVYLDSAATALRPQPVIDAVVEAMAHAPGPVHRAVHILGDRATRIFETTRRGVAEFIGAEPHEIVFTQGATAGLALLARAWRKPGRIVCSLGSHHSTLLPWQGNVVRLRATSDGLISIDDLEQALRSGSVSLVVAPHVSNVTGAVADVAQISNLCHAHGAALVLDAAHSVPHMPIDVGELGCDFLVFSGHKMCAPAGIGILYGKAEQLEELHWVTPAGGTIEEVLPDGTPRPLSVPQRFEPGSPPVEAVAGLGAAVSFLDDLDMHRVCEHVQQLVAYMTERLHSFSGPARIVGSTNGQRLLGLTLDVRPLQAHQVARALSDRHGVCVRSGYHCAQPLHMAQGWAPTLRASVYVYTTRHDIDRFFDALADVAQSYRLGYTRS